MHEIGSQLVGRHQAGDQAGVDLLRGEFRQTGEQLLAAIQNIQTEVLISAQRLKR